MRTESTLPGPARIRRLFDAVRRSVRAAVVGWFIVFSLLGNPATIATLGGRAVAGPASNGSSPTEEEEHASRTETAVSKAGVRPIRRKALSRPILQAHLSLVSHLDPSLPTLILGVCIPPPSEHAMRNSIGGPLRC